MEELGGKTDSTDDDLMDFCGGVNLVVYPWSSAIDSNSMTRWNIRSNACTCALVRIYVGAQRAREIQIRRRRFIMAGTSCET